MRYNVNFDLELRKNTFGGLYIALEGIDGSGKTTQAEKIAEHFKSIGKDAIVTAEPTRKGEIGSLIHEILRSKVKINRKFFQYLFSADRGVHQEELIIPALKTGKVVIADRCFWSTLAYGLLDKEQEDGKGFDNLLVIYSILSLYHQFIAPDMTFFLDTSVTIAVQRLNADKKTKEIYENEEFVTKVKKNYELITDKFKKEFVFIDGDKEVNEVSKQIISKLKI